MDNIVRHTYSPLPPRCIRLLKLEPAVNSDAPLCIEFVQDAFDHVVGQYEAISYAWGEPDLTHPVYVSDATQILVTSNLDRALRRLRHSQVSRIIWVDGLCINQMDLQEKAYQIPLMVHIFRGARQVVAWLGGGSDQTDEEKGLRILDTISRQTRANLELERASHHGSYQSVWLLPTDGHWTTHCINSFLRQHWWSRLWIVQEVVFNPDVVFLCGGAEISWTRLRAALLRLPSTKLWDEKSDKTELDKQKIEALLYISDLWQHHCTLDGHIAVNGSNEVQQDGNAIVKSSMLEMLEVFHDYGCTDPRDRIFAIYSMASDIQPCWQQLVSEQAGMIYMDIDYELNVEQTYQVFALACIRSGKFETLINSVASRMTVSRQYARAPGILPSWVPDWRIAPSMDYNSCIESWQAVILGASPHCLVTAETKHESSTIKVKFPATLNANSDAWPPNLRGISSCRRRFVLVQPILPQEYRSLTVYDPDVQVVSVRNCPTLLAVPTSKAAIATREIEDALKQYCFFIALEHNEEFYYIGRGSADLEVGDKLVPVKEDTWVSKHVVLRPTNSHLDDHGGLDIRQRYSLIEIAYALPMRKQSNGSFLERDFTEHDLVGTKSFWLA